MTSRLSYIIKVIILLFVCCCIMQMDIILNAEEGLFDIIEISKTRKSDICSGLELSTLNNRSKGYLNKFIVTYDVSAYGTVMGFEDGTIVITDIDNNKYSILKFDGYEPIYYLNWNDKNINLIMTKVNYIFTIAPEGTIIDVFVPDLTSEKTIEYMYNVTHKSNTIQCGEYTYTLRNSDFWGGLLGGDLCDELVQVNNTGKENVVFKSTKSIPSRVNLFVAVTISILVANISLMLISVFYIKRGKVIQINNTGDNKTGDG